MSFDCDKDVKNALACIGGVTKVSSSTAKAFGCEIKVKNIMFEVSQISHPMPSTPLEEQSNKILNAIGHIGEKESVGSTIRGGVIYYSTVTSYLTNLVGQLQDEKFITYEMTKYNLSFILFLPDPAKIIITFEKPHNPKLLYVAEEHSAMFGCLDSSIQVQKF